MVKSAPARGFRDVAEVPVEASRALLHEEGWQSWSPTTAYRLDQRPWRGRGATFRAMKYKNPAGLHPGFAAEGLLALDPGDGGDVRVWAAADPTVEVPEIRAARHGDRVVVSADGPVVGSAAPGPLPAALGAWASGHAVPLRSAPTIWCSWYQYGTAVTEADVIENLDAIDRLRLPVDVLQIDDGYQAELGDWLALSGGFRSLPGLVRRIRDRGRRAGIWLAPFLVGSRSPVTRQHPDWLVGGAGRPVSAGRNWDQDLYGLDTTHPAAAAWIGEVVGTFAAMGFDFVKLDFAYAAALPGERYEPGVTPVQAYRRGLELVRAAAPDAYLLGCGAPVLPSVGLVDAMRVSPDVALHYEPAGGDLSQPSQRSAALNGVARAYQHGRFWVNDADCLVARPQMQRREEWAGHVARYGGLRGSSDRLAALDGWGLATTRRLLSTAPPPTPFPA